jgi:hypothetical protein
MMQKGLQTSTEEKKKGTNNKNSPQYSARGSPRGAETGKADAEQMCIKCF